VAALDALVLARLPDGSAAFHLVGLVVLAAWTLGFRTRLTGVLAFLLQVWLYQRDPWYQHGGDRVMRFATLAMVLSPAGAAWSIDHWLEARKPTWQACSALVPGLARRLIQVQLAVIYMHSGWVKAQGSTWHEGTALYYALSDGQYQRAPQLLEPLLGSPLFQAIGQVATWMTLIWEGGFGLLILWGPTRAVAMVLGLLVHGGIGLMLNVGSFVWIMLWCYLALLPADFVERVASRWQHAATRWRSRG
jgi:Vitamin K-dependent gamma-carboxylase